MEEVNPSICPICEKENNCMVNKQQPSCWCMTVSISDLALQQIPKNLKNKQCICQNCNEKAKLQSDTLN